MPNMNPLVLKDRASPPVSHTFNPRGQEGGSTTFAEPSSVPIAEHRITVTNPKFSNGRARVVLRLSFPVVQDVVSGGVSKPSIVRTNYAELSVNFDQTSSLQERDDMIGQLYDLIKRDDNDTIGKVLINLEGLW